MLDNPQTPEEWQTSVNLAAHVLLMDSLQRQGLITSNKAYDVERARAVLEAGKARGFVPPDDQPPNL